MKKLVIFSIFFLTPFFYSLQPVYAIAPSSLQFDGASDIARTVNIPLSTQFTYEAWVKRTVDNNTYQTFLSDATSNYGQAMFTVYVDGGSQDCAGASDQFAYYQINGGSIQCSGVTADIGTWHHVAVTRDSSGTRRFFIDGALRTSQNNSTAPTDSSGVLSFGRAGDFNGEYFAGIIDEVRISNIALYTASFAPPTSPLPSNGNTVAIYHLDDGTGQVVSDSSANVRHGILGSSIATESSDPTWSTDSPIGAGSPTPTPVAPTPTVGSSPTPTNTPVPTVTPTPTVIPTSTPTPTPSQIGVWSAPFTMPLVAVNMVQMANGKVLMWDGDQFGNDAYLWEPTTNTFTYVRNNNTNMFCSGQTLLSDGNPLVIGGHINAFVGVPDANRFNYTSETWTPLADMSYARWYPTITTLPDGRILTVSGAIDGSNNIADIPEVYNPVTNTWTQMTSSRYTQPLYPFMFVLPNGKVLYAGSDEANTITRTLDVANQVWTDVDTSIVPGGSAAMYRPGVVIKSGSPGNVDPPSVPAVNTAYVIDMNQPIPAWRQVGSMAYPRTYHTLTILPDGDVIVTGGVENDDAANAPAVFAAEIWDQATETWATMASAQVRRSYHSTGLLLPDGRVLVAGSGRYQTPHEFRGEIFSPPYLFRGSRPSITSAPAAVSYGSQFFVETPDSGSISTVSLVALGAVTHQIDMNQRYVPLTFSQTIGGLNITSPANANFAPPGHYMLFLVNSLGVPSVANFLRLDTSVTPTPTPTPTPVDAGFSLRFYGHGVSAPDLDRVKIQIDDPANSNPGPPADVGATDFTLEFWMKAAAADNTATAVTCGANLNWIMGNIVFDRDRYNQDRKFGLSIAGGNFVFGVSGQGTGDRTICGTSSVLDNQWHHVAIARRRSDGFMWLFVDGVLQAQVDGPDGDVSYPDDGVPGNFCGTGGNQPCITSDPYLVIGAEKHDAGAAYPSYNGFVDEVRLSTILRYAANFIPPTQPFTADANTATLYHLNEGAGDVIGDVSGAIGGPSNGVRRFGGSLPAGPEWTSENPFGVATPTLTPFPTSTPIPTSEPTPTPTNTPVLSPTPTVIPTPGASRSLSFDGTNDIVGTVNLPLSTQFTYEAWVKRTADNNTYQTFLSDATSNYGQAMFTVYVDGGSQDCAGASDQFAYYQINGGSIQCSGVTADIGTWHHVAVTRDSAGARRFFVDGILRNTQTNSSAPTDSSGVFTFGRAGAFNGEYFAGVLDEIRVSNISRYSANFTSPTSNLPTDANTVGLWHLSEGSGQTTSDASGNGRNGTLGTTTSADSADPTWFTDSPVQ